MSRHTDRVAGIFIGLTLLLTLAVILVATAGCASPAPTPTPTRTPKPAFTSTPTPLPPTDTPQPTPTPVPPTDTPQPTPTATPVPDTPTPTPLPPLKVVAGPPAQPLVYKRAPALPTDVCPLTGLRVDKPENLNRRPLAIKVSNSPDIVRPQAGLDKADVVFEHYAEAGLTRFTAVFLSQDAEKVGSVRSARLVDLEIVAMFQSLLGYSGSSAGVGRALTSLDYGDRIMHDGPGFVRIPAPGKAYEHTLFTSTAALWQLATDHNVNQRVSMNNWVFSSQAPEGGQPASTLKINYRTDIITAEYQYDQAAGAYMRFILGAPHTEELTGKQLSAKNVIVLYANHVDTDMAEDTTGSTWYYSIQIQIWGQGRALIFRDGQMYDVNWLRPARDDLVQFQDAAGNVVPLKPGNTWVQFVPLNAPVEIGP
jgi:hypothetical protein